MRLHKKEVFQRAHRNLKRLRLFNTLHQLLIEQGELQSHNEPTISIDTLWQNRIELTKRLEKENPDYVDPHSIPKDPLEITPFLVSAEVIEASRKENVLLVEKMIEEAVRENDEKLVERLVFRNMPRRNLSRLSVAFQRGYLAAAQYFVDKGDDIEERNNRGETLFHWQAKQMSTACKNGPTDIDYARVKFLIQNNANPHLCDNRGFNPISYAGSASYTFASLVYSITEELQFDRAEKMKKARAEKDIATLEKLVFETLPKRARETTPRFVAALDQGYDDTAFLFAQQGDNVDVRNENGETLLYVAVAEMDLPKVMALLRMNASPNAPDKDGATPLMVAGYNRNADPVTRKAIIRELLEAGADDKIFDRQWNSAYDYAKTGGISLREEIQQIKATSFPLNYRMVLDKVYYIDR